MDDLRGENGQMVRSPKGKAVVVAWPGTRPKSLAAWDAPDGATACDPHSVREAMTRYVTDHPEVAGKPLRVVARCEDGRLTSLTFAPIDDT